MITTKEIAELLAVLYSIDQDCFHIEDLKDYQNTNVRNALLGLNKNDYRMIGVFKTYTEADSYIKTFRIHLKKSKDSGIDHLINNAIQ